LDLQCRKGNYHSESKSLRSGDVEGKPNVLVAGVSPRGLESLLPYASLHWLETLEEDEIDELLPSIDCVLVQGWWPESLTSERISRMSRLRFIQSGMAGVNHIPFAYLGRQVVVSSNAGAFSAGVAEFALALTLAAAKRLVKLDNTLRTGEFEPDDWGALSREIMPLKGMTLGILGYGGIGRAVASMGMALGMRVIAFSRDDGSGGVETFKGKEGLVNVLRESDTVVIALPLSKLTAGIIGGEELEAMKDDGILVNVARAEIVDEEAIYRHLLRNPGFTYATDVWQIKDGKETFTSRFPLAKLPNFIGTPHVAGASAAMTGEPGKAAVENLLRYLRGEPPHNVVDASEYV
jgi:D-3-phosphoglycerate dehydrogenase / 2-oxoglutarate reductase